MKLIFDGRYIRTDFHDGISKFSARLIEHVAPLAAAREIDFSVLISDPRQSDHFSSSIQTHLISSPTSPREPWVAHQVNRLNPDVVFSPMQTMGSSGRRYRLVLTIHDLIYYSHPTPPSQFNVVIRLLWRAYHLSWWPQRFLLSKANAVVAVSGTTKQLIVDHNLTRQPVHIVHNAADIDVELKTPHLREVSKRVVYMGSFMPYKNVDTLVLAMAQLPDYELHLLSRVSEKERERLIALAPQARLVFYNGCTETEYANALAGAHALLMASKDEGFGIPVVEAMAAGTPVVLSDIPIFREVAGPAGLFVENSAQGFVHGILSLENRALWRQHSEAARKQARTFSWERSARELVDVLVEVASAKSGS